MKRTMQAQVWSIALALGLAACSSSKGSDGGEKSGSAPSSAESGTGTNGSGTSTDGTKGSTGSDGNSSGQTGNVPAAAFNIPELIGKMTWSSGLYNNSTGKVFTGFAGGANVYKILVDVGVGGDLPETIQLTEEQAEKLYTSPEYKAAAKTEVAKISLEVDAAFFTSKLSEEYEEGRVYELTTVKAGTTTIKAKVGTKEIPLAATIAAYTAAQITAGKNRYNTAVAGATPSPACATCHRAATGVDHSPYYMSQYTDAALLSTIETGVNSDDNYQTESPHKMTFANANDKAGIVPYLRSLDPNLLPDQQAQ